MPYEKRRLAMNRAHQRFPTNFDAMIECHGRPISVKVADISARGARLCFTEPLPRPFVGSPLVLRAINLGVGARIVWRNAGGCGVALDRQIAPLDVVRGNYLPLQHLRNERVEAHPPSGVCRTCGLPPRSRCVVCQRGDVVVSRDYMAPDVP